ncbi:unnamed protein product [Pleuronectes platessa]|uniref:Uncharacterized protein n=1 Tax=Pleuronectes platessa TaxID=8262 RepID=A0A9N7YZN1_PLEPL|nr:unnamed protein product [Pleuronectes platessa]
MSLEVDPQHSGSCFGKQLGGRRGCECITLEPSEMIVVDNGSEGDDSLLQREGSQRRSRRRFRRVNPRGERELITDGQEPASYNTSIPEPIWSHYIKMQVGPAKPQGPRASSATARPSRAPGREREPGRHGTEKHSSKHSAQSWTNAFKRPTDKTHRPQSPSGFSSRDAGLLLHSLSVQKALRRGWLSTEQHTIHTGFSLREWERGGAVLARGVSINRGDESLKPGFYGSGIFNHGPCAPLELRRQIKSLQRDRERSMTDADSE